MTTIIDATVSLVERAKLISSWESISWDEVVKQVRRLQMRIAKAWNEGKFRTVKTLQRLLQKSFYAKLLAVKRVSSNKGSKTPGVDKIIWKTADDKMNTAIQLGKGKYIPLPLRRIYILKKNGKKKSLRHTYNAR